MGTGQDCRQLTAGPGLRLLGGTPRVTSAPSDDQSRGAFKVLTCISPASGGCRPRLQIGKPSLRVTLISAPLGSGLKFQSSPNCHCCSLAHGVLVCNTGVAPGAWNSVLSSDVKTPLLGGMERGSWGQPLLLAPLPQWRHRLGTPYHMLWDPGSQGLNPSGCQREARVSGRSQVGGHPPCTPVTP